PRAQWKWEREQRGRGERENGGATCSCASFPLFPFSPSLPFTHQGLAGTLAPPGRADWTGSTQTAESGPHHHRHAGLRGLGGIVDRADRIAGLESTETGVEPGEAAPDLLRGRSAAAG